MATKATKKAPSKKEIEKIVKKTATKTDFKSMDKAQIEKFIADKTTDRLSLQQSHKAQELVNPHALTANRKEIARALTALRALRKEDK